MTTWLARSDGGSHLLCGRQVAGRYACQGTIARLEIEPVGHVVALLDGGFTEDPLEPGLWRLTAKAKRKLSNGRRGPWRGGNPEWTPPTLPWRRDCPHCGFVALVTADVLSSDQINIDAG